MIKTNSVSFGASLSYKKGELPKYLQETNKYFEKATSNDSEYTLKFNDSFTQNPRENKECYDFELVNKSGKRVSRGVFNLPKDLFLEGMFGYNAKDRSEILVKTFNKLKENMGNYQLAMNLKENAEAMITKAQKLLIPLNGGGENWASGYIKPDIDLNKL